jgi:hypothetical protein
MIDDDDRRIIGDPDPNVPIFICLILVLIILYIVCSSPHVS